MKEDTAVGEDMKTSVVKEAAAATGSNKDDDLRTESTAALPTEDGMISEAAMPLPMLKYTRIKGSIPRTVKDDKSHTNDGQQKPLSVHCTCACIGRVILPPLTGTAGSGSGDANDIAESRRRLAEHQYDPNQNPVMAMGYENGLVSLVAVKSGASIVAPEHTLFVREVREGGMKNQQEIVHVSIDASGGFLAAIDVGGMCAIWELRYSVCHESNIATAHQGGNKTSSANPNAPDSNVFATFMTALAGAKLLGEASSSAASTSASAPDGASEDGAVLPVLRTVSVQVSRISYPQSFGRPTCMALDPSYKRRREKSILVGFADGRLVWTKRGFFQRRSDTVIYQGTRKADDKQYHGIEAIAWRGPLVAWADASGIKLVEVETSTRIAHIDRPAGARASLYPTISSLKPSLVFETSNDLLVAWGDCLMAMYIRESKVVKSVDMRGNTTTTTVESSLPGATSAAAMAASHGGVVQKRRTVECKMAWELDCVACGVAPLDDGHVAVLGLVPPIDDELDEIPHQEENDLELQIFSREDGSATYSDILPLYRHVGMKRAHGTALPKEPASVYMLLSSFALPRMEDAWEREEEGNNDPQVDDFDFRVPLFSPTSSADTRLRDSHLKWNLKTIEFDDEGATTADDNEQDLTVEKDSNNYRTVSEDGDSDSVDSDDYGFIFESLEDAVESDLDPLNRAIPPLMVVASQSDIIVARMRDADDAVSHALSSKKCAVALRRALIHKRRIRRFKIADLVSEYLGALLKINDPKDSALLAKDSRDKRQVGDSPLSLRRLKLAAQSMPALIGGDVKLWEKWIYEFEKIPGALFVVRDYLPVRDPILPTKVYERVISTMLIQIERMKFGAVNQKSASGKATVTDEAAEHFLSTLIAWGPTKVLKEYIKLVKYHRSDGQHDNMTETDSTLTTVESLVQRRFLQTAAGYLQFPVPKSADIQQPGAATTLLGDGNLENDSLFNLTSLLDVFSARVPILASQETRKDRNDPIPASAKNSRVALDAFARLSMMQGAYDQALRAFLAIGALHSGVSLAELESEATETVAAQTTTGEAQRMRRDADPYIYVLAMIEYHHLHQYLLDTTFVSPADGNTFNPLFCLIRLVGLDNVGAFLMEHCIAARDEERDPRMAASKPHKSDLGRAGRAESSKADRRETLPINLVADSLSGSQRLLHWYLHLVFAHKPELYFRFPNTAYPPRSITELHRRQFDLCIEYAGAEKDSAKVLLGVEPYKVDAKETVLLSFLKATLPLGGNRVDSVIRRLETAREEDLKSGQEPSYSSTFALELAYVMEHYGELTEDASHQILDLYLQGTKSLALAASYAQRTREYSTSLWAALTQFCLKSDTEKGEGDQLDGRLYGSLMEAAALCGADLAQLVTQIPPGMAIEDLRPRLVAAVADYRLKLKMHEAARKTAEEERVSLLRELTHRSRRGTRYLLPRKKITNRRILWPREKVETDKPIPENKAAAVSKASVRIMTRRDRHSLAYSLPMR